VFLGLFDTDFRELAERQSLLTALISVPESPPAAIVRRDKDV